MRASFVASAIAIAALSVGCGGSSSSSGTGSGGASSGTPTSGSPTSGDPTSAGPSTGPGGDPLGMVVMGQYNLGPVDWAESAFHNACSPYPDSIKTVEGNLLAGLDNSYAADGSYCDACIKMTTAKGHTAILRVVTYGVSNAPGDSDLSQEAYDMLTEGEYPRDMHWQLVSCPGTDPIYFQYQTGANTYWTSLWVRNPRIAIKTVEVKSANHADFFALDRGSDGTYTDNGGFGDGAFTLRVTGLDGSTFSQDFPSFTPGDLVTASGNL